MDDSISNLPTSHLLGSVPAVVTEGTSTRVQEVPGANLQIFPPNSSGNNGPGYQTLGAPSDGNGPQPTSNWKGLFSISSYTEYFNVDTDIVLNRVLSSLFPMSGDFFSKIDANPDLFSPFHCYALVVAFIIFTPSICYGLVWISTTLVFVLASLGNCATYLMQKRSDSNTSWTFDVGYVNVATFTVYGYVLIVPLAFYFLLQYMGAKASLVQFWCLWGYSLFIFNLSSILLIIPIEFIRWTVILVCGAASASFVSLNLRSYIETNDATVVLVAAFFLQMALAVFIKMWFFP